MPVPSSISDLDTNPNNNSPQGSEPVGPNANAYLQAAFAFIKQLSNGSLKPTAAVDLNAQKLTNIAQGALGPSSKDAVRGDQLYKIGEQKIWHGAVANISTVWGVGWQLADGTNGTADMRDRFVVGAGLSYGSGATGGASSTVLSVAQLPPHNHPVSDPGHNHAFNDPGHNHADAGHNHLTSATNAALFGVGGANTAGGSTFSANLAPNAITSTGAANIQPSLVNGSNSPSLTRVTTQNTGSGSAIPTLPPYYASCILEYTGIGA